MLPIEAYFPRLYRQDLALIRPLDRDHGPVDFICYAHNCAALFDPGRVGHYADRTGFLCVTFFLNLARVVIEQTTGSGCEDSYHEYQVAGGEVEYEFDMFEGANDPLRQEAIRRYWACCDPYLDIEGCSSACGFPGIDGIIGLADANTSRLESLAGYRERPIELRRDQLDAYAAFFINEYLSRLDARAGCEVLSHSAFETRVRHLESVGYWLKAGA